MELRGRTALVVGAGSGVGRGVALALGEAGAQVVAADVDLKAARQTASQGREWGIHPAHVDATRRDSLAHLAATHVEGALDLLVVTAGVIDSLPLQDTTDAAWQWAWEVNVMASVRVVETFLPSLRRAESPRIVLTGSGSGLLVPEPDPLAGLYNVTKHALVGYSETLREALRGESVGVTLLVPSGVEGDLAATSARSRAQHLGTEDATVRGGQPAGRVLLPAVDLGRQLVAGLQRDRDYVNNRGAVFAEAIREWVDTWENQTR